MTGAIDAEELGTTLIHEHLVFRDEAVLAEWPHAGTVKESEPPVTVDDDGAYQAAVEAASAAVERGVKTIGEPTAMFGGPRRAVLAAGSPTRPASRSCPAPASTPTTTCRHYFLLTATRT